MVDVNVDFILGSDEPIEADFELEPDVTYTADIVMSSTSMFHDDLYNRDLPDQHPMSAITGLEDSLESKVDKTDEGSKVYGTDENGDQTTYDLDSFGKVDDVQVGGVSVVTDKIAELGTMAGESASDYYTSAQVDVALSGKQDTISDLSTIRENASHGESAYNTISGYGDIVTHDADEFATSAQGALADTALQPNDNISELNNDAGYITSSAIPTNYVTTDTAQSVTGAKNFTQINNANGNNLAAYNTIQSTNDIGNTSENLRLQGNGDRPRYRSGNNVTSFLALQTDIPTVDQTYDGTSSNPQSGIAVASAVSGEATLRQNADNGLQSQINDLKARGRFLALWDSSTGLAESNPPSSPYIYKSGDYFIVGTVSTATPPVNYKPDGSSYTTGIASTVVETEVVDVDDVYYYDGTNWRLQVNTQKTVSFVNIAGDPYDNTNLANALNAKADSSSLATVATTGEYSDLLNKPTIPTVNDATLTIQKNSTTVGSFTANQATNATINLSIPTDTSDLTNGAGFITASALPTDYYTKAEIDGLIPQPTKQPIVYFQPTDSYCYDSSNNRFYGSHVNQKLYLVKPKTSGTTKVIDMSTTFSLEFTIDYQGAPSSAFDLAEIITSYSSGKGIFLQLNSTGLYYKNNVTGTTITGTRALTAGNSYDVKIEYDGTHAIIYYKLSSDVNYTQINSTTCTADGSYYNYVMVNMNPAYGNLSLSSVTLLNGGNTLYSYTAGKIALDYDGSLTLNGSNQLSVVVDQTFDGTSANPQSGVAIAGAGFITGITSGDVTTALGYTPVNPSSLATVATSGDYDDLLNKPTIPTVNNATLTIQKNGVDVQTFTANQSTNATANITVPTDTADLTNSAGYVDQTDLQTALNTKQDLLTSANAGTDISITEGSIIESTTESGTGSVTLASAKANGLSSVKLSGALTRSATPTPASPASFTCNNGVIGISGGSITTTGTTETVEDELGNTATAERLLSFDIDHTDEQEIITGVVTRRVGIKVLDGTETTSWTVQSNRAYALKSNLGMSNCLQPTGTGTNSLLNSHFSNNTINNYGNVLFNYTMSNIGVSDVTSWNNWLATQYANGTPVIVIYPLNASATESVTAQTLTTQLGTNVLDITQSSIADLPIEATYDKIVGTTSAIISFTNDSGFITGITSGDVTTALGYTPVDPSNLATVATTGDYDDLLNKPTIPAAQVNSDWNAVSGVAEILNKPTLGTMASESASDYTPTASLATVATSGLYSDLSGTPTIPTVDQTYDGTSANAQSGVAIAGAGFLTGITSGDVTGALGYTPLQSSDISNMVTTDTVQTITELKTFENNGTASLKTLDTRFARGDTTSASDIYSRSVYMADKNGDLMGDLSVGLRTNGRRYTRINSTNHAGNDSSSIYVGYDASDNVFTYAPSCDKNNSILTTTSLSTSSTYTRLTLGNGVKIAAEYLSGISGSTEYTWNYGITFTEEPMVVITRRGLSASTSDVVAWTRGAAGTSSCKIYSASLSSGNTYNVYAIAIGH